MLWYHIIKLMRLLDTEPRIIAELLLPSQCLLWIILLTLYSMVWDWRVLRAGPMPFHWPKLLAPFLPYTVFSFSSFFILVGIVDLGPALHCRPLLIIISRYFVWPLVCSCFSDTVPRLCARQQHVQRVVGRPCPLPAVNHHSCIVVTAVRPYLCGDALLSRAPLADHGILSRLVDWRLTISDHWSIICDELWDVWLSI